MNEREIFVAMIRDKEGEDVAEQVADVLDQKFNDINPNALERIVAYALRIRKDLPEVAHELVQAKLSYTEYIEA